MSDTATRPDHHLATAIDAHEATVIRFPIERRVAAISAEAGARRRHPSAGPPSGRCS